MGLIDIVLGALFGGGRNVIRETAEVFRENAETGSERSYDVQLEAMGQHGDEFKRSGKGRFDQFMDGVNRLPRPLLALGTLGLFVSAMVSPLWFAERMQGIALVPEPLWWLLGVVVSFYFGARHQIKAQQFQRELVHTMARVPQVTENIRAIRELRGTEKDVAATDGDVALELAVTKPDANPALEAWRRAA